MSSDQSPQEGSEGDVSIGQWLESIQLGQYTPTFLENGITFEVLRELTDNDLKECGVNVLGHRKLILQKIRELHPKSAPAALPLASAVRPKTAPVPATAPVELPPRIESATPEVAADEPLPARRNRLQRLASSKVFVLSVVLHVLFGLGAAFFIVQRIQAKRKITFQGGPHRPTQAPAPWNTR